MRHNLLLHASGLAIVLFSSACAYLAQATAQDTARSNEFDAYVAGIFYFFNERSELDLPHLNSKQLEKLEDREVVGIIRRVPRDPADESLGSDDRVFGMLLVDSPKLDVWLAALDPDIPVAGTFHDFRISSNGNGGSRWYVLLEMPWPISNRTWVADLSKSVSLSEESGGLLWEHRWDLAPGGLEIGRKFVAQGRAGDFDLKAYEDAVYTPMNKGGLIVAQIDEETTLLIYHLSTVVGGYIPDSVVSALSRREVANFLRTTAVRCETIREHYVDEHVPIFGGDGLAIPTSFAVD